MRKRVSRSGEIGFVLDYARYLVDAQLSCINFELENVTASGNSYSPIFLHHFQSAYAHEKREKKRKKKKKKKKKENVTEATIV